jgi:hypothetical protein
MKMLTKQNKELVMKRTIAPTSLVIVFATVFVLGIVPRAQANEHKECSNATLHGSFGYTATGTLLPAAAPPPFAGPFAEVGRQTFDGNGNTTATATINANGNIINVTIQGTYTVNSDCTGSMARNVSPLGDTAHDDLVIDDNGLELRTIATDPGAIETYVYSKQFRQGDRE